MRAIFAALAITLTAAACADEPLAPAMAATGETIAAARPPVDPGAPRIAFNAFYNGTMQIYTVNADGSDLKRLRSHYSSVVPAWSPDRQRIAFLRQTNGGGYEIFTMDARGRGVRQITRFNWVSVVPDNPSWSADGTRIVFTVHTPQHRPEIYVVPSDGSAPPLRLTTDTLYESSPVFSPAGGRIAFARFAGSSGIFVMDEDGTNITRLNSCDQVACMSPAWSPDGSMIAYQQGGSLYVMAVDAPNPVATAGGLSEYGGPTWSPDGSEIAYTSFVNGAHDLFAVPATGGEPRRITDTTLREHHAAWAY